MQLRASHGARNARGSVAHAVLVAACVIGPLACGGLEVPPSIKGGPGTIAILSLDGGAHGAAADHKPQGTGGTGGIKSSGGGGKSPVGGQGGQAGGTGAIGGNGAGGSHGGTAGGGPVDDPCVACEKAKCAHPSGTTADLTDSHNGLAAAIQLCFGGGAWPASIASSDNFCGGGLQGETAAVAAAGDAAGMPKTTLCQALLACIHRTNCTQEPDVGNNFACYCGDNVDIGVCLGPTFKPTGQCVAEFASAMEADQLTQTNSGYFTDLCLASGAALDINLWCDANCCVQECLKQSPIGNEDLTYCGAAAAGGAAGTGGASGAGGHAATGGAAGAHATGGMPGTGGTSTGGGGAPATGGTPGTGGSSPPSAITNGTFDTGTVGWAPGVGVTLSRSSTDFAGNGQSGSLDIALNGGDPSLNQQSGASQCLSVSAGASLKAQAAMLVPGQTATQASITLWFYGSPDCSGAIGTVFSTPASVSSSWQLLTAAAQVPGGARSVSVRLAVLKPIGQTSAEARFDNVTVTSP
jgi:hypothetical protein